MCCGFFAFHYLKDCPSICLTFSGFNFLFFNSLVLLVLVLRPPRSMSLIMVFFFIFAGFPSHIKLNVRLLISFTQCSAITRTEVLYINFDKPSIFTIFIRPDFFSKIQVICIIRIISEENAKGTDRFLRPFEVVWCIFSISPGTQPHCFCFRCVVFQAGCMFRFTKQF